MSERDYAPLSSACVRGLCDKLYEKRKCAGVEIEKMVKDFHDASNTNQIRKLLRVLQELIATPNPNVKNGALMGLSSVAVGLGRDCVPYLPELVRPLLACAGEADSRVRYQAIESLYNVAKVARGAVLTHFADLFDALGRLATDSEPQVKQGAEFLDRLLKEIVTESSQFDLSTLVALLRERLYTRNAFARQFLISWVSVLDSVPDVDLLVYLPEILDGLLKMLDDPMPEIKRMCEVQLSEFLRSIKREPARADLAAMINILVLHAQASDELLQLTAITWIKEFVELAGVAMLPYMSGILIAVLPCLAYNDDPRRGIKDMASIVNFQLIELIASIKTEADFDVSENKTEIHEQSEKKLISEEEKKRTEEIKSKIDLVSVVEVLSQLLHHNSVHTKVAVLKWILHLYSKLPNEMSAHTDKLFLSVVGCVTDGSDDVVRQSLAVLAEMCSGPAGKDGIDLEMSPYYHKFLTALLRLLASDENLLEDRGAFIIRQLCVLLNAEDIYKALARILLSESDLKFVSTLVDVLSTILMTSAELYHLRKQLKEFDQPGTRALFVGLYECWCHSPVSLLTLCLLTHNYAHCKRLVRLFGDLEVTVDFLTEIDKLVQLIESPVFAYVRLEMLESGNGELCDALYGLLMLLPQSEAFHTLRTRLQCAHTHTHTPQHAHTKALPEASEINFEKLLQDFLRIQEAHRIYKLTDRTKTLSLFDHS